MWASVREIGTEIHWDDCDMDGDEVDDQGVTCNVWENEDELNCKLGHNETGISNSSLTLIWRELRIYKLGNIVLHYTYSTIFQYQQIQLGPQQSQNKS